MAHANLTSRNLRIIGEIKHPFDFLHRVIFNGFMGDCQPVDLLPRECRTRGRARSVAIGQTAVIQTPKRGARIMRYQLADYEGVAIKPMLPNKPRGFFE